jgi:hypothetical protein
MSMDMSEHIHHVRGRLRVRNSRLKRSPATARTAVAALRAITGVVSVEANIVTGSLLVYYDPNRLEFSNLIAAVERFLPAEQRLERREPAPVSPAQRTAGLQQKVAETVFWYAIEKAVERAAPLVLSALL